MSLSTLCADRKLGSVDDFTDLPGAELIAAGLLDAAAGAHSVPALLVAIGAPRLRRLGLSVVDLDLTTDAELLLYGRLRTETPDAFSRYKALIHELVSFERALEHRQARARRALGDPTDAR